MTKSGRWFHCRRDAACDDIPDSMTDYAVGQRWLSETETELGLGIVVNIDYRLVTLFYPACEEERTYAKTNAPLSRMVFGPGDTIENQDGDSFTVESLSVQQELYLYQVRDEDGSERIIPESQLGYRVSLTAVADRLFSKQLDSSSWFNLRVAALYAQAETENSPVLGLRGPRVDLIGHQLWIAHDVGTRKAPRVLLADEVGLGKTIEAGLILHQQWLTERARRILIVVPPALVHQWFVEMVRRFNLHFSIFDHERLAALQPQESIKDMMARLIAEEAGAAPTEADNPFSTEQLILISTDFLAECDLQQLIDAQWDLLIVDEAHHLAWSPDAPSEEYQRVAKLADAAEGLLLLTATPEQLGLESHFARLQLLDPARFHDLDAFRAEQAAYREVADVAAAMIDQPVWDTALRNKLAALLPDEALDETRRDALLAALLDRSGTGRVLYRNTRKNISGFPQRQLQPVPLAVPPQYAGEETDLFPERGFSDDRWCAEDPRVTWLADFLRRERSRKVLIICAHKETAIDLHAWCGYKLGMNVAVFHEDMDLISRDRAAAYFADFEDGAQALICSEIGSEGRNFQFAHDLVLMDLPRHPDLLEQRIGRLDRIGQKQDIQIHVPYFTDHAQAVLFHWYHDGMGAFSRTNPAGSQILAATGAALEQALAAPADSARRDALVADTAATMDTLLGQLESGRDRLLELGSHDPNGSAQLIAVLAAADAHTPHDFMERVFERFGVEVEEHSEHADILRPGAHMLAPFPGLPEEGVTVTTDRSTALSRDDMLFLTWEHPMVTGAIELVLGEDRGKAATALLRNPKVKAGTLLVELIYSLRCSAPRALQVERFLPTTVMRSLLDAQGRDLGGSISHDGLSKQCQKMDKGLSRKVVESQQTLLTQLLAQDQKRMQALAQDTLDQAREKMETELSREQQRLRQLQQRNADISDADIAAYDVERQALTAALAETRCHLAAVRVIVAGG